MKDLDHEVGLRSYRSSVPGVGVDLFLRPPVSRRVPPIALDKIGAEIGPIGGAVPYNS